MANQVMYGFYDLKSLFNQRVTQVEIPTINTAIDLTLEEHNRQSRALVELFAQRTTDYSLKYKMPGARRLQPLDEHGRARPTQSNVSYPVAFPIFMGGDAFGQTFVARAKMRVEEVNDELADILMADNRWLRDQILAALFTNVTYTFDDPQHDDLTIQPLANGDTVKFLIQAGADTGATDTHFLAQAAAIADATNPYPVIYSELTEHPQNQGEVVAFIPTDLVATTLALANFIEIGDPAVQVGANVSRLVGNLGVAIPGTLLGRTDKVWVVEWKALPAGYIVAAMTEGAKALAMREDEEPELQGFKRVADRNDHPYYESQYLRRAGFGALNRVGALVYRIGNGTYAIPTNYTAPVA